ncbi:Acetyltransferase, GNAT family [Nitrospina gracilis 3/211]|uniref:Acetyltransferase, GNAT family n=1 Tax=Nitrospina gracilis (strain 3/211) TaxID=1266370 RepID=M1Z2Q6_NITG3|nr:MULTISPECIES: GNAT family N-acetyltransferase [Nitrospina]MCF8724585.1 GNAT superfamily N-acetyltransferase [Nitrospina sp. Nb-3]CCQ91763.1 Acetyltransferase, GNAT family [Nitrospina gracilis 3/211]
MPETVAVREGRPEDALIITKYNRAMANETESKCLHTQTVLKGVQAGLARPELCRYFVAEVAGHVIGQAMITYEWSDWRNGQLWWLQSVYVHPDHRRQGVFRKLYRHIESLARTASDVRGIRLYVEEKNRSSQSVYAKLGLLPAGYHVYEREFE